MKDGGSRIDRLRGAIRSGDPMALGRALTIVESGRPEGRALLAALREDLGRAKVIGVTGPPGAGKSTLVDALIRSWRAAGERVAVLAVDPVSPISGGAVLGDRTRMGAHSLDDGVFIRSASARGHLGGLSIATHEMADVMDAAGWPIILIESVGAGQSETEIAQVADVAVVVCAPGLGDDLQAIKAGILEIADILVVNKADRDDAEQTAKHLQGMLALRKAERRDVPVTRASSTERTGIEELRGLIEAALARSEGRAERLRVHKTALFARGLAAKFEAALAGRDLGEIAEEAVDAVVRDAVVRLLSEASR
ncbi:MAG: methylmalonyl Co-A mutase-associated GTPase MeaB [Pseudomonadota bacterium]